MVIFQPVVDIPCLPNSSYMPNTTTLLLSYNSHNTGSHTHTHTHTHIYMYSYNVSWRECRTKSRHKTANRSFETLAKVQLSDNDTNISKQQAGRIKYKLNAEKAFEHTVRNLLSSRLLFKSIKIKTYRTITLPWVLYAGEGEGGGNLVSYI